MELKQTTPDWLCCTLTKARLGSIEDIVNFNINSFDENFNEMALHILKTGGKKLRPSLFLLALNTGEYYDKQLLHPAAALELIHVASLHHDDVMDRANRRRNTTSVNAQWGNMNATYSGNYLFSKAISMLSGFNKSVNLATCQYVSNLCLGQLQEAENAYNLHLDKEKHIEIIKNKTASLFELPCKLGGILADADKNTVAALFSYGEKLGIAFQMIDDLLDLKGDPKKTGKVPGTDLKEGVYTYATIHALEAENSSGELADLLLLEELEEAHISRAIEIIKQRGGMEAARNKAQEYVQAALEAISSFPDNDTKKSFLNLAKFITSRDH